MLHQNWGNENYPDYLNIMVNYCHHVEMYPVLIWKHLQLMMNDRHKNQGIFRVVIIDYTFEF